MATPAPMVLKPMEPIRPMGAGFAQPPSQREGHWP
jgi:hypothetical protein